MKSAFVTGATGFLGLHIVEQLQTHGWSVRAVHRPSSNVQELKRRGVELAVAGLDDRDALTQAMIEEVDAVFHVAGNTSIWRRHAAAQTRDNVGGTENVLSAARAKGAKRFVYTSTWCTFGLEHEVLSEETAQTGHLAPDNYSRSKHAAETAVLESGIESVILNPAHIMGRYDRGNWSRLITMVDQGRLPGIPPGAGAFSHAVEVARAHVMAATQGRPGARYLLGGEDRSFVEVIGLIGEMLGRKVPRKAISPALFKMVAWAKNAVAAVTGREPD
ncbi:MAG: NAD-dependent epimerase/dehydratase family protein, partial [Myxococcota bacterium]